MSGIQIKFKRRKFKKKFLNRRIKEILDFLNLKNAELSVLITDDTTVKELNKIYRGKDKPTDVLSFPMGDEIEGRLLLGDVVISADTAYRQAVEEGITVEEKILQLLIHGILHLIGYDHEKGKEEEKEFFNLERRIRAELGIS